MADSRLYVSEYRKSTGDYKHCIATEASLSIGHPFRFIRGFMNVYSLLIELFLVDKMYVY